MLYSRTAIGTTIRKKGFLPLEVLRKVNSTALHRKPVLAAAVDHQQSTPQNYEFLKGCKQDRYAVTDIEYVLKMNTCCAENVDPSIQRFSNDSLVKNTKRKFTSENIL